MKHQQSTDPPLHHKSRPNSAKGAALTESKHAGPPKVTEVVLQITYHALKVMEAALMLIHGLH
jgi:hypothetical protein